MCVKVCGRFCFEASFRASIARKGPSLSAKVRLYQKALLVDSSLPCFTSNSKKVTKLHKRQSKVVQLACLALGLFSLPVVGRKRKR